MNSNGQFVLANKPAQSVGQQKIAFGGRWMTLVEYTEAILKAREEHKTELISRLNNPTELAFPKPPSSQQKKAPTSKPRDNNACPSKKGQSFRWSQAPQFEARKFGPTNVQQYLENTLDKGKHMDQSQLASYMFNSPVMLEASFATMANHARAEWAPHIEAQAGSHPAHSMAGSESEGATSGADGSLTKKDAVKLKFTTSRLGGGQYGSSEESSFCSDERIVEEISESSSEAEGGSYTDQLFNENKTQKPLRIKKIKLTCGANQDVSRHTETKFTGSAISYNPSFNHTMTPPSNEAHLIMHSSPAHAATPQLSGMPRLSIKAPQRSITSTVHDGKLIFSLKPESRALVVPVPLDATTGSAQVFAPQAMSASHSQSMPDTVLPSMVVSGSHSISAPPSHFVQQHTAPLLIPQSVVSMPQSVVSMPQSYIMPMPTSVHMSMPPSLSLPPRQSAVTSSPQPILSSTAVAPPQPQSIYVSTAASPLRDSPSAIPPDDYKPLGNIDWLELSTVPLEQNYWPRYLQAAPSSASPLSMLRRSYYEKMAHKECTLCDGKVDTMDMFKNLKRSFSALESSEESADFSDATPPAKRRRVADENQSIDEPTMALLDLTMTSQSVANVPLITLESPRDQETPPVSQSASATVTNTSAPEQLNIPMSNDQAQSTTETIASLQIEASEVQSPSAQVTDVKVEKQRDERDEILEMLMGFFDMEDKIKEKQEELAELFVQHQKMRQKIEDVLQPFMKYRRLTASQSSQDNK